jgi:hypothetical protein
MAKLTPDLSDYYGLMWRLGAIERRETGERIMIVGRVAPECHRVLRGTQLGRKTGATMTPGKQHVQIGMTHEPRIGPRGVSCLHPDLTHPG